MTQAPHKLVALYRKARVRFGHTTATRLVQRYWKHKYDDADIAAVAQDAVDNPVCRECFQEPCVCGSVKKYAANPDFERKHPRGQPENAGEFATVTIGNAGGEPGQGVHVQVPHGSTINHPAQQQSDPAQTETAKPFDINDAGGPLESDVKLVGEPEQPTEATQDPETTIRTPEELDSIESSLNSEPVSSQEVLPGKSANEVLIITTESGRQGVFKPRNGERRKLRDDIPGGTYATREAVAFTVAKIVGMADIVPVTTLKTIPGKPEQPPRKEGDDGYDPAWGDINNETLPATDDEEGSVQEYIDNAETAKAIGEKNPAAWDGKRDAARSIVFDFIMGNTDRHMGNWLIDGNGAIKLIDNGLTLPEKHSLDSVIRMGHAQNMLAHKYAKLPLDEAKAAWNGKLPEVAAALKDAGIPDSAIKLVEQRYEMMMQASNFNEAIIELNKTAV